MTNFASGCKVWEGRQVLSSWLQNLIVVVEIRKEGLGLVMKRMDIKDSRNFQIMGDLVTARNVNVPSR